MTIANLRCRMCGCTKDRPCTLLFRGKAIGVCSWVELATRPLCRACVPGSAAARQQQLPGISTAPAAHWARHQQAHVASAPQRKARQ